MKKIQIVAGLLALMIVCSIPTVFAYELITPKAKGNVWDVTTDFSAKTITQITAEYDIIDAGGHVDTYELEPINVAYLNNRVILIFNIQDLPDYANVTRVSGTTTDGSFLISGPGFAWARR